MNEVDRQVARRAAAVATAGLSEDTAHLLGVCRDCGIKHPTLHRETHSGMFHEARVRDREESPEAKRIRLRKERRQLRCETRQVTRMVRIIGGEHVRARPLA